MSVGTTATIRIPEVFSIIREPKATLEVLAQLVSRCQGRRLRQIHIDHSRLVHYDLAAEIVLDLITSELHKQQESWGASIRLTGEYPTNVPCQRFIRAVGIIKSLKISHEYLPHSESGELEVFELYRGQKSTHPSLGGSDSKSTAVQEFADFINRCLKRNGKQLTKSALGRLCNYTGEIITNAEDHSGSNHWYMAGYLDNSISPHVCEIAIFNLGKTFSETFVALDPESFPRRQVDEYVKIHKQARFFSPRYRENDLYALVALQGGVSSKNLTAADTRGQGTIDLIDFFESVCTECVSSESAVYEMAILSGRTHIKFDGTNRLTKDTRNRRIISFNKSNRLADRPDSKYVRNLPDVFFPGTVISIRFPLQPSQTTATSVTDQ